MNEVQEGHIESRFSCEGVILGNTWMGGQGLYIAPVLNDLKSYEELVQEVNRRIQDGSFQPHGDFDEIKGAFLAVHEKQYLFYQGHWWKRQEDPSIEKFGDMDSNESAQLLHYLTNVFSI